MKGTIISIAADGNKSIAEHHTLPKLEMLKDAIGGGYIELVPGFHSFRHHGKIARCVVFCDEDGKYKRLPINHAATMLWDEALRRNGHPGLTTPDGRLADYLVGPIAIVVGDNEFLDLL